MGLRSFLGRLLGRAAPGGAGGGYGGSYSGGPAFADAYGARRSPGPQQLVQAYKSLIYICTQRNAVGVAKTPLRLYATTSTGQRKPRCAVAPVSRSTRARLAGMPATRRAMAMSEDVAEVVEHPILDALSGHEDPLDAEGGVGTDFTLAQTLAYLTACLDVCGAAYLRPVAGVLGAPAEVWPLIAQYVSPVRQSSGTGAIERYNYLGQTILPRELIRVRWVGLSDPYGAGYPPALACIEYAGLEDKWVTLQDQILGLGPRPSIMLTPKDGMQAAGEAERRRFEMDLRARHGKGREGNVMVSNGAWDLQTISYPPADLGGLEIGRYDLERIANAFCVPLPYLTGETNLANLQAAHRQHAEQALEPRCDLIAAGLTRLARRSDERLFFAFDACSQEDRESTAKVVDMRLKNGTVTINEARAEDGMEAVDWGDEPWLAQTLRQPSEERPAPPPPPGQAGKPGADGEPPEGEGADGEPKPDGEEADAAAEKALIAECLSILRTLKAQPDEAVHVPAAGDDGRPAGDARTEEAGQAEGAEGGRPREHVWSADGEGPAGEPDDVVPGPGDEVPGDRAVDRPPDPGGVPAADGLRRPDGPGDDAPGLGLLGPVGEVGA